MFSKNNWLIFLKNLGILCKALEINQQRINSSNHLHHVYKNFTFFKYHLTGSVVEFKKEKKGGGLL